MLVATVVFGLFVPLTTLYVYCIHKRIKFAAAQLKVAGKTIFRLPKHCWWRS